MIYNMYRPKFKTIFLDRKKVYFNEQKIQIKVFKYFYYIYSNTLQNCVIEHLHLISILINIFRDLFYQLIIKKKMHLI